VVSFPTGEATSTKQPAKSPNLKVTVYRQIGKEDKDFSICNLYHKNTPSTTAQGRQGTKEYLADSVWRIVKTEGIFYVRRPRTRPCY
jgi:hypothetical protein